MFKPTILCLGEVLWDDFPSGRQFGGAPANVACHAALQHADVKLISAVGEDHLGDEAIQQLERFGVDTSLIQRHTKPTGLVTVRLDVDGQPTYAIQHDVAWDEIEYGADIENQLLTAGAVYFGTLSQRHEISRLTIRRILNLAKRLGIPRFLDVNLRPPFDDPAVIRESVQLATVLKCNQLELPSVLAACGISGCDTTVRDMHTLMFHTFVSQVVVTRGADGAMIVDQSGAYDQPGIPVTAFQNTVGAGDAMMATLMVGLLRKEDLPTILRRSCERAAEVCGMHGALTDC